MKLKVSATLMSLIVLGTLTVGTRANAQQLVEFFATAPGYCGQPIHVFGFQSDPYTWQTEMQGFDGSQGDTLQYTWYLSDATGVIASGSYSFPQDGYGGSAGFTFTTPNPLVYSTLGDVSFTLSGYQHNAQSNCNQSFSASTITTGGSGGYVRYE